MRTNHKNLSDIIKAKGWFDIPKTIISREGKTIDLIGEIWEIPYSIWQCTTSSKQN